MSADAHTSSPGSVSSIVLFFIFLIYLFILTETERASRGGMGWRGGVGRERIPSRFHTVNTEPDSGLELTNREIMT